MTLTYPIGEEGHAIGRSWAVIVFRLRRDPDAARSASARHRDIDHHRPGVTASSIWRNELRIIDRLRLRQALDEGTKVSFEVTQGQKGPQATDVQIGEE